MNILTPRLAAHIGQVMDELTPPGCVFIVTLYDPQTSRAENVSTLRPETVREIYAQLGAQPVGEVDIAYG